MNIRLREYKLNPVITHNTIELNTYIIIQDKKDIPRVSSILHDQGYTWKSNGLSLLLDKGYNIVRFNIEPKGITYCERKSCTECTTVGRCNAQHYTEIHI